MKKFFAGWLVLLQLSALAQAPAKLNSSEIFHELQKLNFLGSALYVAAHPDDENTRLISFLSNDIKARTAYLSLTRGDGGQNLVGPEIRELLGVIRSQELLAARRIDGGQQFFSRANDFGYSKNPDETLKIWDRDQVLSDVVRTLRKFKPDIVINRFNHRNPGTTHGHHTSSAMLSFEAFDLAGDATRFPETAQKYGTWQPRRLFFNTSWWFYGSREKFAEADKTNLLEVETGTYYPLLGQSNGEIAGLSRSMHKSQGFGSAGTRGSMTEWLEFLKGDFPDDKTDLFNGIDTSWSRVKGGDAIKDLLQPLEAEFDFKNPESMLPRLLQAYELVCQLEDLHWRSIKKPQLENLILQCAGVFVEASATTDAITKGDRYQVNFEAINRSGFPVVLQSLRTSDGVELIKQPVSLNENSRYNEQFELQSTHKGYSTPYWLNEQASLGMYQVDEELIGLPETPAPESLTVTLQFGRSTIVLPRAVVYKYTGPVRGEVYRPFEVLPEATVRLDEKVLIFPDNKTRQIRVTVRAGRDDINGTVQINHPDGWQVQPEVQTFKLDNRGQEVSLLFDLSPPDQQSDGYIQPLVNLGNAFYDRELITIDYDHIPYQRVLLPARAKVARIAIEKKGNRIGYIPGAGDAIPQTLGYLGYEVTTLDPAQLTEAALSGLDAVVVGIRAFNTVPELRFKNDVLFDYAASGGVVVVQYNTSRGLKTDRLAPYKLELSRDRVTDEHSPVRLLDTGHPAFNKPNKITIADFDGWVQERGLYFPDNWDNAFKPLLALRDPGSPETTGSLLVARHGKGYYVYTGLSFFRELPAGVPGAYRLFVNLLSLGK